MSNQLEFSKILNQSVFQLTALINNVKDELVKKLEVMEARFSVSLAQLERENLDLRAEVNDLRDTIERRSKETQLTIRGIPVIQEENLNDIFNNICNVIGHSSSSSVNLYRLVNKITSAQRSLRSGKTSATSSTQTKYKHKASIPPVIILTFSNSWDKSNFFFKYIKHKSLNLSELGFSTPARVFIGENLSKHNYEVFRKCISLKKNGQISKCYTKNGLVYIVKGNDNKQTLIKSVNDLS